MDILSLRQFLLLVVVAGCVHACTQGARYPVPRSCGKYEECINGSLVRKSCGLLKRFDARTQNCTFWWRVSCSQVECLEGETKPAIDDCSSYFSCEGGKWISTSCYMGHKFNPTLKSCAYGYDCSKSPVCQNGDSKMVEGDCKAYSKCEDGKWVKKSCFLGRAYDVAAKECTFSQECPECREGESKPLPGSNCSSYVGCRAGRWEKMECGIGKRYDRTKGVCALFYDVPCEVCKEGQSKAIANTKGSYQLCKDGLWVNESCHWPYGEFDAKTGRCVFAVMNLEEQCEGSWKKPVQGDCQKYRECVGGTVVNKSCTVMMRFDTEQLECRFGWFVKCDESLPPKPQPKPNDATCKEFQRKSVPGKCEQYMECQGGKYVVQSCLLDRKFDAVTLTCKPEGKAKCAPSSWEPSFLAKDCEKDEIRAIYYRCDGYQMCQKGQWLTIDCPTGQRFDSSSLKCVDFQSAKCLVATCQEGDLTPDSKDCQRYNLCSNGQEVPKKCSVLHRFDPVAKKCTWRWKVDCSQSSQVLVDVGTDKPPTTKPTTAKPTTAKPTTAKPPTDKPTTAKPTTAKPTTAKPTTAKPTTAKPPTDKPTTAKPTTAKPPTDKPTTANPTTTQLPTTKGQNCPSGTVYPSPTDVCKGYVVCDPSSGKTTTKTCSWCKNFDPSMSKCVWSWKYRCSSGPTPKPSVCTDGQRVAVDCKNYRECISGDWVNKSCGMMKKFDKVKLECVYFSAQC